MKSMKICINTIDKVKEFNSHASKVESNIEINSVDRHYIIDAKSLMGIFSLDLSKPVLVTFNEQEKDFENYLQKFAIA